MATSFFQKAMPWIVGIGIPVGVLLAGSAFPIAWDLKGAVGELKATLGLLQLGQQRSFDDLNKRLDSIEMQMMVLAGRSKDAETDPSVLLSRAGMSPSKGFGSAYVNGSFYVFPQNRDAENQLIRAGYRKEPLTPVISGYVAASTGAVPAPVPMPAPR